MKKFLSLSLCLALLLLSGCRVEDPLTPDPPAPEQPPVTQPEQPPVTQPEDPPQQGDGNAQHEKPDTSLRLEEKYESKDYAAGGRNLVHLDLNYPYAAGTGETADSIREYYDVWADKQRTFAEYDLLPQAESQFSGMQDGAFMPYALSWSFDTARFDGKVISVLQTGYQQTGGAHPLNSLEAQNFNAENGGLLSLADLFPEEPNYLELLRALILPMMQKNEQEGTMMYYGGYDGFMMQVYDPTDFLLTETGLTVFWQTDSIAPHAAGIQQFELTYAQLGDALDARWKP